MNNRTNCYTVGLTGGIASGKSAVSQIFEQLGCDVIDTDVEARLVVEPGTQGLNKLINTFGESILSSDETLDRAKLRKIVFNNKNKLLTLNSILHPLINQSVVNKIKCVKKNYCIIVIPLLCESSSYEWLDRTLVVDVKPKTQLSRLLKRDAVTEELANKMMRSQCSREKRLSIADDVVNNEQTLHELRKHVKILNRLYKTY